MVLHSNWKGADRALRNLYFPSFPGNIKFVFEWIFHFVGSGSAEMVSSNTTSEQGIPERRSDAREYQKGRLERRCNGK